METFTIDIVGSSVSITRGKDYTVEFVPKDSTSDKVITKNGTILGLSTGNRFLRVKQNGVEYSIPVDELVAVKE